MTHSSVDLFTKEEHVIIAGWLGIEPRCDAVELPTLSGALACLGFTQNIIDRSDEEAAVAAIVLERIQERLPQWAAVGRTKSGEADILLARDIKERRADRLVELTPQFLLTINWADSGPGFSWPVAYHLTWVPIYDVYVVTQSADSPDMFGYCDFAIGHFPKVDDPIRRAGEVIRDDWHWQHDRGSQCRWECLFGTGRIDAATAEALADEVWGDGAGEWT